MSAVRISPDTLDSGDQGYGALDGLIYRADDVTVLVTVRPLVERWLADHRRW